MNAVTAPVGRPPEPASPFETIVHVWTAHSLTGALKVGIVDSLASGPKTTRELASELQLHEPSVYRLLRALTGSGVFAEAGPRRFALTDRGAELLGDHPGSARGLLRVGQLIFDAWANIDFSLRTGRTAFEHVRGLPLFDYLQANPEDARLFNEAMTSYVSQTSRAVLDAYSFAPFENVVDVGGGHGALMLAILHASPQAHGYILDLPHVIAGTREIVAENGLAERCDCFAGDFFQAVPEGGDAYVLASIVHDWDDERAVALLKTCRRAMSPGKRLLLIETVVPESDGPSFAKFQDVAMLVTTGGQERTETEFRSLLTAAGFRLKRIIPTHSPASVVEGIAG